MVLDIVEMRLNKEATELPNNIQRLVLELEKTERLLTILKRHSQKTTKLFINTTVDSDLQLSLKYHHYYTDKYKSSFNNLTLFKHLRSLAVKKHYKHRRPISSKGEDV